jgi:hypothetical protein
MFGGPMKLSEAIAALERGEELEFLYKDMGWEGINKKFTNFSISFLNECKFRLKPNPKPRVILYEVIDTLGDVLTISTVLKRDDQIMHYQFKTGRAFEIIDSIPVPYIEGEK